MSLDLHHYCISYTNRLNPYYNGKYSMRIIGDLRLEFGGSVLILIIMENTL